MFSPSLSPLCPGSQSASHSLLTLQKWLKNKLYCVSPLLPARQIDYPAVAVAMTVMYEALAIGPCHPYSKVTAEKHTYTYTTYQALEPLAPANTSQPYKTIQKCENERNNLLKPRPQEIKIVNQIDGEKRKISPNLYLMFYCIQGNGFVTRFHAGRIWDQMLMLWGVKTLMLASHLTQ